MSRRTALRLLELGLKGAGVMAAERLVSPSRLLVDKKKMAEPATEADYQRVIGRELLADPASFVFKKIFTGHSFTIEHEEIIKMSKIKYLLGEVDVYWQLEAPADDLVSENPSPFEALFGTGTTQETAKKQNTILQKFFENGGSILTTDVVTVSSQSLEKAAPADILMVASLLFGDAAAIGAAMTLAEAPARKGKMSRRQFLKWSGAALAVLTGKGILAYHGADDQTAQKGLSAVKLAEGLILSPKEFLPLTEETLDLRNAVMALNSWNGIARVLAYHQDHPAEEKPAFMFMAGRAHRMAGLENIFLAGVSESVKKVESYVERYLANVDALFAEGKVDENLLAKIIEAGKYYSQPFEGGQMKLDEKMRENMPPSAFLVFVRKANEKVEKLLEEGWVERAKRLQLVLSKLLMYQTETDVRVSNASRKMGIGREPTLGKVEIDLVPTELISLKLSKHKQLPLPGLYAGVAEYNGLAAPVSARWLDK